MTTSELNIIGSSLEWFEEITDTPIGEIVLALKGVCWDEEDAVEILEWFEG